jgi:hypothetical protein
MGFYWRRLFSKLAHEMAIQADATHALQTRLKKTLGVARINNQHESRQPVSAISLECRSARQGKADKRTFAPIHARNTAYFAPP